MVLTQGMEQRVEERRPPVENSAVARVEGVVCRRLWICWAICWAASGWEGVVRRVLCWKVGDIVFGLLGSLWVVVATALVSSWCSLR